MASNPPLLLSRRFGPMCLSQALGAFVDNLVKNGLVTLAIFVLHMNGAWLAALAGSLFIIPYVGLSAPFGQIADRFVKSRVFQSLKAFELLVMIVAAYGLATENVPVILGAIVGLGIQSAAISPLKFGMVPELLSDSELLSGNGMIETSSFLGILGGTALGGAALLIPDGMVVIATTGVILSAIGLLLSLAIPARPAASPVTRIDKNIFRSSFRLVRDCYRQPAIWRYVLGISFFWTVGVSVLSQAPLLAQADATGTVSAILLAAFVIGTAIGSVSCSLLMKSGVTLKFSLIALMGIAASCLDIGFFSGHVSITSARMLLSHCGGLRLLFDLVLLAASGGVFLMPLYTLIQTTSAVSERARVMGANNIVNAAAMIVGSGAVALMGFSGMSAAHIIEAFGFVTLAVLVATVFLYPQAIYLPLFRLYFRICGVDVTGIENYAAAGDKVVIVANHLSFMDGALLSCTLPQSPTFAIHSYTAEKWWVRPFLVALDVFKVDVQSAYAVKRMVEAVRDGGKKLMIFPEGRLTKTGGMMKIYEGASLVADKAGAMVLPISIDGLQFTPFGRMKGKLPLRWFPRLSVRIMPPVSLSPQDGQDYTPRQRRAVLGRNLFDVMVGTVFQSKNTSKTLFTALVEARETFGDKSPIIEDITRSPLTYDRVLLGALALGRNLATKTQEGECVGLMLPTANATVVSLFGLLAFNRKVHTMNISMGHDGLASTCRTLEIKTIVSSRAFAAKAKLEKEIEFLSREVRVIWLEDIKGEISLAAKLRAKFDSIFLKSLPGSKGSPDDAAVILATSGSEGKPKGVVLSHRNILANCAQLSTVIDFNCSDIVFNAMPMFHSFGLTGGTLLPILHGVKAFHYPSPLHYRIVPTLIYDTDATICFGTDTFLNGWARYAHPYDFRSVRYIFAGAEKVKDETKRLYAERFGVRIMEGYGATETAPVIAMNTAMHPSVGTVGRMLPGMDYRLEEVPGIASGSRLHVRGPNVMKGYLLPAQPGVLVPPVDGWYDTGDIVSVDSAGYVRIEGRAKRFAKIAGEMVSLTAAETLVTSLWPDEHHAVVNLPDPRKGEQIVLVTTHHGGTAKELLAHARSKGIKEIMVPRTVISVDKLPLLGPGKVNYPAVTEDIAKPVVMPAPKAA